MIARSRSEEPVTSSTTSTTKGVSATRRNANRRQTDGVDSGTGSKVDRHPLLQLQQRRGNRAVQRAVNERIQPKLEVGRPNDKYEREANRVAEQVVHMPSPPPRSQAGAAVAVLQRTTRQPIRSGPNEGAEAPALVQQVLDSSGHPLDLGTRTEMETRFGQDFRDVRVHTDTKAAESARAVGALAYTAGRDIVFDHGRYSPDTHSGRHLLAHELTHVVQQKGIRARGHRDVLPIQRQSTSGTARQGMSVPLPDSVVDQVVQETIIKELNRYRNILVKITGSTGVSSPGAALPAPVTKTVTVQATYFINSNRATYGSRRRANDFNRIVDVLRDRGEVSEIQTTKGGQLSSGRTVELGKATPDDIRVFIQEAVDQGIIRQYAITQGILKKGQQLVGLSQNQLQNLIQDWVDYTGVGVDCSGFVLYASIRARERVRETAQASNWLLELFNLPMQFDVPPELKHEIRSARSYSGGPQITVPTDLRPGDAWVVRGVRGGDHIRIVTRVEEVTLSGGGRAIEFDTAESSSAGTRPGPVDKTWRTASLTNFNPIVFLSTGLPRGSTSGTFHRIL